MRPARRRRSATIITTAALLGALAFPSAAAATTLEVGEASEPSATATPTVEPTPTGEPEPTTEVTPTATPVPTAEPTATPVPTPAATTAPVATPAATTAPVDAAPQISLPTTSFTAGDPWIAPGADGWGDGLDVTGTGFAPNTVVVVSLNDGADAESTTTAIASATGELALSDWQPMSLPVDGTTTTVWPHLARPGEQITASAEAIDAAGVRADSNAVELDITQPAPGFRFVSGEDASPISAGDRLSVAGFRFFSVVPTVFGFDRDESILLTLTAPDGTTTALPTEYAQPLYGQSSGRLDESTMADQFGTFTVTATGADSGRTASASLVQVPDPTATLRIWPASAPFEPAPGDGQPTSGGAVWGFGGGETVSVGVFSVDGVRQRLVDGGTRLTFRTDAVGWSQISIGQYPLADPEAVAYCVVALGESSGRLASTTYDYGRSEADPIAETADCSAAEAAARGGSGTVTTVAAGKPALAATGVSTTAPLALAAFGVFGGLALLMTRRRRA